MPRQMSDARGKKLDLYQAVPQEKGKESASIRGAMVFNTRRPSLCLRLHRQVKKAGLVNMMPRGGEGGDGGFFGA